MYVELAMLALMPPCGCVKACWAMLLNIVWLDAAQFAVQVDCSSTTFPVQSWILSTSKMRGSFFPRRDAFSLLADKHARYAIFHMDLYADEDRAAATARITEFAQYLTPLYADDNTKLYAIADFPPR